MARSRRIPSLYVVRRVALSVWSGFGDMMPTLWANEEGEQVQGVPVQGFATKKAARTAQKGLERQARETTAIGPFLRGLLPERTGWIEDAAAEIGLPPPDRAAAGTPVQREGSAWQDYFNYKQRLQQLIWDWWNAIAPDLAPSQNAQLWDLLFPKHRFYDVVRVLLEE